MKKINFEKLSEVLMMGDKEKAYAIAKQMTPAVKKKVRSQLSGLDRLNYDIQTRH